MEDQRQCSLCVLNSVCSGPLSSKDYFSADEWTILKARSGLSKIRNVCSHHIKTYLTFYSTKQKYCSDPKKKHTNKSLGVTTLTVQHYKSSKAAIFLESPLIPGQKLCKRCATEILPPLSVLPEIDDPTSSPFTSLENAGEGSENQAGSQDLFADDDADTVQCSGTRNDDITESTANESQQHQLNQSNDGSQSSQPRLFQSQGSVEVRQPSHLISPNQQSQLNQPCQSDQRSHSNHPSQLSHPDQTQRGESFGSFQSEERSLPSSGEQFLPKDDALAMVNAALKDVKESPINKRKLSRNPTYGPSKVLKLREKVESLLEQGGAKLPAGGLELVPGSDFYDSVINALKKKYEECSTTAEKVLVLSVALAGLPQSSVTDIFGPLGASNWLVRKTSNLMKEQGVLPKVAPKKGRPLSDETVKIVINYYEDDINSRQLPGKKDFVSVRVDGQKQHIQKRMILMNLKELHQLFQKDHPSVKVSFSKFASLRPQHCVFAGSAGTHSICVCQYHQNVKLMIEGANLKSFGVDLASYQDFLSGALCDPPTAKCFLEACCHDCPGFESHQVLLFDLLSEEGIEKVEYKQWSTDKRSSLDTHQKDLFPFVESLMTKMKDLLPHHFITKQQARFLKDLKEDLLEGEAITICDFSENITHILQDSVQGYYFSNDQSTVYPVATLVKVGGELKKISQVIVSDYMKHDKDAVYVFNKKHIQLLKKIVPGLKKVYHFSDGATGQFKNCFNILNVTYFDEDHGVQTEWHFFATSHGKGPSDGLGGLFKRLAAKASLQGKLIRTALELVEWAKVALPNMNPIYVSAKEVEEGKQFLQDRFKLVLNIDQIRSFHKFIPVSPGEVEVAAFSQSQDVTYSPVALIRKVPSFDSISVGDFISVHQTGKRWTVAQVSNKDDSTQEILATSLSKLRVRGSRDCNYKLDNDAEEEPINIHSILTILDLEFDENKKEYLLSQKDKVRNSWQLKAANAT